MNEEVSGGQDLHYMDYFRIYKPEMETEVEGIGPTGSLSYESGL